MNAVARVGRSGCRVSCRRGPLSRAALAMVQPSLVVVGTPTSCGHCWRLPARLCVTRLPLFDRPSNHFVTPLVP